MIHQTFGFVGGTLVCAFGLYLTIHAALAYQKAVTNDQRVGASMQLLLGCFLLAFVIREALSG